MRSNTNDATFQQNIEVISREIDNFPEVRISSDTTEEEIDTPGLPAIGGPGVFQLE